MAKIKEANEEIEENRSQEARQKISEDSIQSSETEVQTGKSPVGRLRSNLGQWRLIEASRFVSSEIEKLVRKGCVQEVIGKPKVVNPLTVAGLGLQEREEKDKLGDFWETNDSRPIHLKETEAVLQVLKSIEQVIRDSRVDLLEDNVAVLSVWNNQGGRDRSLNNITKVGDFLLL
uniref:Uncharacterized protein n=1 Tax=Magallana gigas TaxID=29159 RepID=A0A8W8M3B8_MAGGI